MKLDILILVFHSVESVVNGGTGVKSSSFLDQDFCFKLVAIWISHDSVLAPNP